jgi:magnesium transporter
VIHVLQVNEGTIKRSASIVPHSWIHIVKPDDDDLRQLNAIGISLELLSHILDPNERSRVVRRGEVVLIVIHFPFRLEQPAKIPYVTMPLTIILLPQFIVTVEPAQMGLLDKLVETPPAGLGPSDVTGFIMDLLLRAASEYLGCLYAINISVEEVEDRLQLSLRNREVLQLLNFQKSLVYFSTALNSIEAMLEKLQKGDFLEWSPKDKQLGEDSLIEIRQAIYQVEIAENILTQMMDAFASIVSNNLNAVMKFLAAITIIISVPMLIASLYGMNVQLPGGSQTNIFVYLIALSLLLSILVIVIFRRMDWF